ncbi:MAG: polyprenyl synthetase family protein [Deltaproteobacteria bacterium]|nr:polyprenyl synthetase family protein [Deltaproteobacteria bacterium]
MHTGRDGNRGDRREPSGPDQTLDVDAWLLSVRDRVEPFLELAFDGLRARAATRAPGSEILVDAIRSLSMRAGKRFRPALVLAGFSAATSDDEAAVVPAAAATELLQTHLLVQDDWMDQDDERRGGPSVHAALRASTKSPHQAAAAAILASDLALSEAVESLLATRLPSDRILRAEHALMESLFDVILGQYLDLDNRSRVQRLFDLKTTSYTVRGPLRIGAILGGGSDALLEGLDEYARHLGFAFQLRDDLLGTFGDPAKTLKPVGADLARNKRTALVEAAESLLDEEARATFSSMLGRPERVSDAQRILIDSGAKAVVESWLDDAASRAKTSLGALPARAEATWKLDALAGRLARREA